MTAKIAIPDAMNQQFAPRYRRVFERLLAGDSEKQIAAAIGISTHTAHQYIKEIYRKLDVHSRAELLSLVLLTVSDQLRESQAATEAAHRALHASDPDKRWLAQN